MAIIRGAHKLKLPGKCVEAWRTGSNMGESYPKGNLVIELIQHGFYHEAQQILDNASPEDRESERIVQAVSSLTSHKKQENEKLDEYTEDTKIHHKYMLLAVETEQRAERKSVTENDLIGSWLSVDEPKNQLDFITNDNGACETTLSVTVPGGGLSGLGYVVESNKKTFSVHPTFSGLTLTADAFPDKNDQRRGLLSSLGQEKIRSLFLVITDNVTMQGFYWSEGSSPKEVLFKRQ